VGKGGFNPGCIIYAFVSPVPGEKRPPEAPLDILRREAPIKRVLKRAIFPDKGFSKGPFQSGQKGVLDWVPPSFARGAFSAQRTPFGRDIVGLEEF